MLRISHWGTVWRKTKR